MVWVSSAAGRKQYFSPQGVAFTGRSAAEIDGERWLELVHPDDLGVARAGYAQALATGRPVEMEFRLRGADGRYEWIAGRTVAVRGSRGKITHWVGTWTPIGSVKRLEHELREAERLAAESLATLEALQATAPIAFGFVDPGGFVVRMNPTLAAMAGVDPDLAAGRPMRDLVPEFWERIQPDFKLLLGGGEPVVNRELELPGGSGRCWLASYFPVRTDGAIVGVGVVSVEITHRKREEEFLATVTDAMAEGMFVLDSEGRPTYMNRAAEHMLGWTLDELKGRDFHEAVFFQREDGTPEPAEECQLANVRRLGVAVRVTNEALTRKDGTIFPIGFSAVPIPAEGAARGVLVVFRDITDEKQAQEHADRELAALTWVGRIRDALDERRFALYSEPIMPLRGGRPGVELLLRMVSRQGDLILPGSFLPVAEKYGLIRDIDRWVIPEAIRQAAAGGRVQVNLSAASVAAPGLLDLVEEQLATTGADPANVVFELTETALMADIDAGAVLARRLVALGCSIAIDDFGVGFGSLTYLKRLPVRYLKIDVDFVRDLHGSQANRHLIRAIVSMARAFGLETIAEGVEDATPSKHCARTASTTPRAIWSAEPLQSRTRAPSSPAAGPSDRQALRRS